MEASNTQNFEKRHISQKTVKIDEKSEEDKSESFSDKSEPPEQPGQKSETNINFLSIRKSPFYQKKVYQRKLNDPMLKKSKEKTTKLLKKMTIIDQEHSDRIEETEKKIVH